MKRFLSMLFVAAGLLLGVSFPHAAIAQVVSCVPVNASGPWPSGAYTQDCTGVQYSAQGQAMYAGLNNSFTGDASGKLATWMAALQKQSQYTGVFYVFNTSAQFLAYAKKNFGTVAYPSSILPGVFGFSASITGQKQAPIYTVIFVQPNTNLTNKIIEKVAAHEAGHYLDWLFASTTKSTTTVSNSSYYATELAYDWKVFNKLTSCGNPGVFNTYTDSSGQVTNGLEGTYICGGTDGEGTTLSSTYSKDTTPQEVLAAAWTYIYNPGSNINNTTYPNLELFAETYSAGVSLAGNDDSAYSPSEADVYLGQSRFQASEFVCTQAFIRNLLLNNTLPLKTSPPLNWPAACPLF